MKSIVMSNSPLPNRAARSAAFLLLALFGGLMLGSNVGCATGGQYPRPAAFNGYPADPALDQIIDLHVQAGREPREARVLLTSWLQDGTTNGVVQFCSVRPDGHTTSYSWVRDVSTSIPRVKDLPPQTLQLLQQALATLPPTQRPPIANMLIVSFWYNGQWQTRLYDRTRRPEGMSTVFALTGAPILP
jgi:hypothetical protein